MYDKYRKQIDEQHASEELISDTLQKMKQELEKGEASDKKKVINFPGKWIVFAASILILVGAVYAGTRILQKPQEPVFAKLEEDINSGSMKFGSKNTARKVKIIATSDGESFPVEIYEDPSESIDQYITGTPRDINSTEVYLTEDADRLYGCYKIAKKQFLVKADKSAEMDQEEFIKVLEAILGDKE